MTARRSFDPSKDYYRLLGVDRQANGGQIRRAFRARARKLHPDLGGNAAAMRELNEAYEVLRDQATRMAYDLDRGPAERDRSDSNREPSYRSNNLRIPLLDRDLLWLTTRGIICALLACLWLIAADEASLHRRKSVLIPWLIRGFGIITLGIGILFGYSAHKLSQQKMTRKQMPRPALHLSRCKIMFHGVIAGFLGLLILSMYLSE